MQAGDESAHDEPLRVFHFNWRTLGVFVSTWHQWHVVTGTKIVKVGMDWTEVEAALKLSGVKRREWPLIFEGLLAMQKEVLEIFIEKQDG